MNEMSKNNRILYFWEKQDKKCYYCGVSLINTETMEIVACNIDHKQPSSRGGKDTVENTCLTCMPCNNYKGNLTEAEFMVVMDKVKEGKLTKIGRASCRER